MAGKGSLQLHPRLCLESCSVWQGALTTHLYGASKPWSANFCYGSSIGWMLRAAAQGQQTAQDALCRELLACWGGGVPAMSSRLWSDWFGAGQPPTDTGQPLSTGSWPCLGACSKF